MLRQFVIASLALAAITAAPVANAQVSDLPSVTVSFAGIDANTDAGAQIMLRRIKAAAGKVCGGEPSNALDRQLKFDRCVDQVTQSTVARLHNTRLAALIKTNAPVGPTAVASVH